MNEDYTQMKARHEREIERLRGDCAHENIVLRYLQYLVGVRSVYQCLDCGRIWCPHSVTDSNHPEGHVIMDDLPPGITWEDYMRDSALTIPNRSRWVI